MAYNDESIKIRTTKVLYAALMICLVLALVPFVMHFLENKPFYGLEFYFKLCILVGLGLISSTLFIIRSYFAIELTDKRIKSLHILRSGDEIFYTDIAKIETSIEYSKGVYSFPHFYLKIYRIFDDIPININITFLTDKQKKELILLLAKHVPEIKDATGITYDLKQGNVKTYHRKMNKLAIASIFVILTVAIIRFFLRSS